METETLSSYEQPQDKHILDESMDVNLPRDDEESDSLESKDNSEVNSAMQHKEIITNDAGLNEVNRCDSSENKENENDCDQSLTNSEETFLENKVGSDNYNESEQLEEEKQLIESEDTNKSSSENCKQNTENFKKINNYDEDPLGLAGKGLLNDKENESLIDDDRDFLDSDKESLNNDEKLILSDGDKDLYSDDEPGHDDDDEKDPFDDEEDKIERVLLNDEENDPLNEEKQKNDDPLNAENHTIDKPDNDEEIQKNDPLSDEKQKEDDPFSDEKQKEDDPLSEEKQKEDDSLSEEKQKEDDPLCEEKQKEDDPLSEEKQKDVSPNDDGNEQNDLLQQDERKEDPPDKKEIENEGDKMENEKVQVSSDVDNEKEIVPCTDEKNENERDGERNEKTEDRESDKNKESGVTAIPDIETNESESNAENNKESSEEKADNKNQDVIKDCPLLKETLTKASKNDGEQQKEADGENGSEDMDMDDDFDPSLLCPDIAMEVDEAPVITSSDNALNDGSKSPLLYEPFFSTYVDEMTGAEVSFNLTPEEQQLRQQTYGEDTPVQYTKIHCTACNVHLGSALDGQSNRFVHPLLKVLICKDCYHFYTSGEFEKDEDGSELYCRWCGQGGQVMCCSGCEMVFCKKCVRINFGRKKLTEIKDSEDWYCFRCNPAQLTLLRIHCAEFMEYVRRELSRAATLENATSFMTTDFTQCCLAQKKKHTEPHQGEPKKKKRKTSVDPDYDPYKSPDSPQPSTSGVKPPTTEANATVPKPVTILPKPMDPGQNAGVVTQVNSPTTLFKVGNTTFRPRATYSQPRPRVQPMNAVTTGAVVRPSSGPGYIKIMPGGIRVTPTTPRTHTPQTFVSSSVRPQPPYQPRPPRPMGGPNSQMKHEWFEKTVRAAARVNSNLSYTLTQLNRAQATATSVEALAVVHNKLQEILSTSINSLIQIRKNLRTEFIAGIKNIRFPSNKPPQPPPSTSTSAQDDDVIFISPTPSPVPPSVTPMSSSLPPLTSIQLPPSISFTKKVPQSPGPSTSSDPIPSTSKGPMNDRPKTFLRVKSLTALQNVPSECITIPDDPLPPPPPLTLIQQNQAQDVTIIDDQPEKSDIIIKDVISVVETDPLQINMDEKLQNNMKEKLQNVENDANQNDKVAINIMNGDGKDQSVSETAKGGIGNIDELKISYNLTGHPTPELKKMLSSKVYIKIKRSEEIDELVRNKFGLVNGNASK